MIDLEVRVGFTSEQENELWDRWERASPAGKELGSHPARHLRSGRSVRHVRKAKQAHGRGVLRNMTSISARPAVVTERKEVGHWEGDLVMGKRPSAVATLVERTTRYVRVVPLPDGYKADAVRQAIAADLRQLPHTCDEH